MNLNDLFKTNISIEQPMKNYGKVLIFHGKNQPEFQITEMYCIANLIEILFY